MTMPAVTLYTMEGKKQGTHELPARIFGVKVDPAFVEHAVVAQRANAKITVAHTKTRAEVRGGGRKPWRQKGTGRARHGSIRSPIWRGGGVAFGPRPERNYGMKINKKERQKALFMALSDKVSANRLVLLDALEMPSIKTKQFVTSLKKLPVERSVLLVLPGSNTNIEKSARNVAGLTPIRADSLNVVDVLRHHCLVLPVDAIGVIEKTFVTGAPRSGAK